MFVAGFDDFITYLSFVIGVTGTLKTLGKFETTVKNETYQIDIVYFSKCPYQLTSPFICALHIETAEIFLKVD